MEKNYKFSSVCIFKNAEKIPIIKGIHRYIYGNFLYIPIGVKINNLFSIRVYVKKIVSLILTRWLGLSDYIIIRHCSGI